jgi:hypothetical protein
MLGLKPGSWGWLSEGKFIIVDPFPCREWRVPLGREFEWMNCTKLDQNLTWAYGSYVFVAWLWCLLLSIKYCYAMWVCI